MNGVIYARYSSDSQREESIEGQLRECMEYADRQGITIIDTYIDRAFSARTADRPDFQRLIKDSGRGVFEAVIVWKLDRFARDRYDSAHYKHILKNNGVKVLSAKENISERPEGILMESLLEGMAEYYSAELSEKISRGQTDNALKCKHNGGWVPLGYRVDSEQCYELDPLTAPIVREIFELYADGVSAKEIGEMLNMREIRTQNGHTFKKNSLTNMLSNRKYIGEYRYGSVVTPGGMPALVSEELFERVQERLAKNKHAPARSKAINEYLLTTKLYCGKCGAFMVGESGTSRTGQLYHYYKCVNTKKNKTCDKKTVKKDYIEDYVVFFILHEVLIDSVINRIADAMLEVQSKENTVLPALKNKLKEIEKNIDNILNAIQQGIITSSTKDRLLQLEADREDVQIAIAQEEMEKPLFTKEEMVCWISMFRGGDPTDQKYRQRLIDTFVNAIYLYDDKIVLITNYKDGTKSVTLEQIEEALSSWEPSGSDIKNCFPPKPQSNDWGFLCGERR